MKTIPTKLLLLAAATVLLGACSNVPTTPRNAPLLIAPTTSPAPEGLGERTPPRYIDFDSYTPRDNYARLTQTPVL